MNQTPRPVEIEGVSKSFGDHQVVRDVSFAAERGEVLGLVGPNGAGKTTTIRMLLDIIKPDSGSIRVFGQPLNGAAKARIGSSGFLLNSIGGEKENRVMEILLSSVTPGHLMVGKILGLGGAGLLQMVVWVVAGRGLLALAADRIPFLSNVSLPGVEALVGILYFVLGYVLFATLMAGLGAVTTTQREGQQITGLFVVPAIIPYYAFPYILGHPDSFIARFLTLFPLTAPITVMERMGVGRIKPWEIVASALILLATCAGALWLVVRLFRAYLLMYGKRPGLREMWRALSQR